jgi:hypothetical protein
MRVTTVTLALIALLPTVAHAQKKWAQIGTTANGNPVYVDPSSVKKSGSLVDATVRIVFVKPVETPEGRWMSARTTATFDCAKRSLAAKENVYYGDAKETKIVERKVNKIPGFGPALGGSLGGVALGYLCAAN